MNSAVFSTGWLCDCMISYMYTDDSRRVMLGIVKHTCECRQYTCTYKITSVDLYKSAIPVFYSFILCTLCVVTGFKERHELVKG